MATFSIDLPDEVARIVNKSRQYGSVLETAIRTMGTLHDYEIRYRANFEDGKPLSDEQLVDVATLFGRLGRLIQQCHGVGRHYVSNEEMERRKARAARSWKTRRSREAGEVVPIAGGPIPPALPRPQPRAIGLQVIEGGRGDQP